MSGSDKKPLSIDELGVGGRTTCGKEHRPVDDGVTPIIDTRKNDDGDPSLDERFRRFQQ